MAIYGSLDSFPVRDVALMIKNRAGLLLLSTPENIYEFYCERDYVRGLTIEHATQHEKGQILNALAKLITQQKGEFRFHECSTPPCWADTTLFIPFCETLASLEYQTHSKTEQQPSRPKEALPHPDIRYILLRSRKPYMAPDLAAFFEQAEPFLAATASATELSSKLKLNLKKVQGHLSELRTINKILPVRAYKQPRSLPNTGAPLSKPAAGRSIVQRLVSLLKDR